MNYDKEKSAALAKQVERAVSLLREHCAAGSISVTTTNDAGVAFTIEADWGDEDEDGDKV